jgi:hypothetical protein
MTRDIPALIACIEAYQPRGFRWRTGRDCVSFAAACIQHQTGEDLLADLPIWSTRREARAIVTAEGGLEAALDARLTRIAPALAQRGDIAGLPDDSAFGLRLMVIEGATLVGPGTRGLERLPRAAMSVAWSAVREPAGG